MKRSPMRRQSSAKRREQRTRARLRAAEEAAGRVRCCARDLVPEVKCWGPIDWDERRSRKRGGDPTDPANRQWLCRAHHDWKTTHDAEAITRGLSEHSWDPTGSPPGS